MRRDSCQSSVRTGRMFRERCGSAAERQCGRMDRSGAAETIKGKHVRLQDRANGMHAGPLSCQWLELGWEYRSLGVSPEAGDGLLEVELQCLRVARHEREEERARHDHHARALVQRDAAHAAVGVVDHVDVANGLALVEGVREQRGPFGAVVRALLLWNGEGHVVP